MRKNKIRMLVLWFVIVIVYCTIALLTEYDFKFLELSAITNVFLLIVLFKENGPQRVEDPISFVKFSDGKIEFSEVSIPVDNINKVALEIVEKDCYFSLPYNQIEPGKFPSFVFPSKKLEEFKNYIMAGLGPVEIIT
ncbi:MULTISPECIES: hypothetical protein [unclassified Salinivibrio]|uniref:hypothetical protein n=1 Tax=unclassified Salinivibrio TaxID=2636825 RepID=UPI00098557D3|nr:MULTISPECIES: hypothetical protein [unclassified Salinivibrio]OOF10248.1 hypothetical protein BZG83_14090 [Salinivibrio sp. PR919]OOF18501.1 hypothetical protein BZG84_03395 [Salinivibrio sp. PR932]